MCTSAHAQNQRDVRLLNPQIDHAPRRRPEGCFATAWEEFLATPTPIALFLPLTTTTTPFLAWGPLPGFDICTFEWACGEGGPA